MNAGDVVGRADVAPDLRVGDRAVGDERRIHEHLAALYSERYRDRAAGDGVDDSEAISGHQELALENTVDVLNSQADARSHILTIRSDGHLHRPHRFQIAV